MELLEQDGFIGINKEEIDALLDAKNFIGLNRSPRDEEIIVSLTSYKPRINDVKYTLYSLLNQDFQPDKLILWLDEDSFPQREENLPPDLLELKEFGLTIDWCEDLRPYKKLIPALEKYPDAVIVTADDDIFYRHDWLKILYDTHLENPDCVIAHRAHRLRLDACGDLLPYLSWQFAITSSASSYRNFSTGAGGVLYRKKFLHEDILQRELFCKLAYFNDDIWFWAMEVLNGTKIKIPSNAQSRLIYVDIDRELNGETLWSKNRTENDVQLKQVIEKYPALHDALIREAAEEKPLISVVLLLENIKDLDENLNNIRKQSFADFELLLINIGSRTESPVLSMNFKFINYPGGTIDDALNLGLRRAAGDYILFQDADSILMRGSLNVVAQMVWNSKADVIHFSDHLQPDKEIIRDDKLLYDSDCPVFFDEPKRERAVLWLQDKLSGRFDTKIFKREFLTRYGINFDKGLAEFLFEALTYAEKYLLVPQAFCFCK